MLYKKNRCLYDYIIVGSGPAALGAVIGLDPKNKVLLISSRKTSLPKKLTSYDIDKRHLKLSQIKGNLFDKTSAFNVSGKKIHSTIYPTKSVGGLTAAWGGQLYEASKQHFKKYWPFEKTFFQDNYLNVNSILKIKSQCSRLHFEDVNIEEPKIYTQGCYKNKNTSQVLIKLCDKKKFSYEFGYIVTKISEKFGLIILSIYDQKTKSLSYIFSRNLILATGTIGTIKLLDKSNIYSAEGLSVLDHTPIIKLHIGFKYNIEKVINNNSLLCNLTDNSNYMVSVYKLSTLVPIDNLIPYKFLHFLLFPFYRRILATQEWNTTTITKGLIKKVGDDYLITHNKLTNKSIFNYGRFFKLTFPLTFNTKFGSGFHYTSCFPMNNKTSKTYHTDLLGRLQGHNNIYLVDGSILPYLDIKNHTLTIIANALRITNILK